MRQITIPARERTLVYRRRFSSIPQEIEFASSAAGGKVERVGSRWILGRTSSTTSLESTNRIRKGYWDTFFEVFVTPDREATITMPRARMLRRVLIGSLVVAVMVLAVVLAVTR